MADGGHFEKSTNLYISATIVPIGTKFGIMTHNDPAKFIGR